MEISSGGPWCSSSARSVLFLGIFPNRAAPLVGDVQVLDWSRDSVRLLFGRRLSQLRAWPCTSHARGPQRDFQLLNRYAWMVDRKHWDLMDEVFAPGATIDYTSSGGVKGGYRETHSRGCAARFRAVAAQASTSSAT
jgi:hypothetical protein